MIVFRDGSGREWPLHVDVDALRRVRKATGYVLADMYMDRQLAQILGDPVTMLDVLFALVEPEARKRGVSAEEFARGFRGEVFEQAQFVLLEALADFFPPAKREVLQMLHRVLLNRDKLLLEKARRGVEEIDRKLKASGDSSTSGPDT